MSQLTSSIPPALVAVLSLVVACSSQRLVVGSVEDGGQEPSPDGGEDDDRIDELGDGDSDLLKAHVVDPRQMRVSVVTVACKGECVSVETVVEGGNPPYTFAWQDGVTSAARDLCPQADSTFSVEVADTASTGSEFTYAGQTAQAQVNAKVLACPDAGEPPAVVCGRNIGNPSFEGSAAATWSYSFDAPPWQICAKTPDILVGEGGTDGKSFASISDSPVNGAETIGQKLCAPLKAGETSYIKIDVEPETTPGTLKVFGSSSSTCAEEELLFESPLLSESGNWQTLCVPLRPRQDREYLSLRATTTLSTTIYLDNIRDVDTCP